ncbi:homoserine dehydrogenase [Bacillus sp. Marseille-P3661]|uniref:homoserine dehydrogenase n=1 Tax=Bacillus sp. Marseille-P3661 TaxID=1936234 RepID=UPI000C85B82D|nr:homoserine dehydrogenase [Bacillus sp. Marseille-P3661]
MPTINVAILGYGTVGKGVYQTINTHQEKFLTSLGANVRVVAVLVKNINRHSFNDENVLFTSDMDEILRLEHLDVVIEAIVGQEPSFTYLKKSISRGCHIITANKEMFAYHCSDLFELAEQKGVSIGFEATVAGGIPIIQTLNKLFNINSISRIEAILNGTSNFILSQMRDADLSFNDALKLAQEKGYAELDPTNDIEGYDAFYKAMILSQVCFGAQPEWNSVKRDGISHITTEVVKNYTNKRLRTKHIATISNTSSGIKVSIEPVTVGEHHPFYNIEGVQNAVAIEGDVVGTITLSGPGAGMYATASAIVEDLVHVLLSKKANAINTIKRNDQLSV